LFRLSNEFSIGSTRHVIKTIWFVLGSDDRNCDALSHSRHQTFGPSNGIFALECAKVAAKFLASHVIQCPIISHRPSLSYDAEAGVLDFVQSIRPGGGRLAGLGRHQSANQNLYHLAEPSQDWKRSKDLQENG